MKRTTIKPKVITMGKPDLIQGLDDPGTCKNCRYYMQIDGNEGKKATFCMFLKGQIANRVYICNSKEELVDK